MAYDDSLYFIYKNQSYITKNNDLLGTLLYDLEIVVKFKVQFEDIDLDLCYNLLFCHITFIRSLTLGSGKGRRKSLEVVSCD